MIHVRLSLRGLTNRWCPRRFHPTRTTPLRLINEEDGYRALFQVWDWSPDGGSYRLHQHIVRWQSGAQDTHVFDSEYRALTRAAVERVLTAAGFADWQWLGQEDSRFYQPVVAARRP